jgi:hypothetical protein
MLLNFVKPALSQPDCECCSSAAMQRRHWLRYDLRSVCECVCVCAQCNALLGLWRILATSSPFTKHAPLACSFGGLHKLHRTTPAAMTAHDRCRNGRGAPRRRTVAVLGACVYEAQKRAYLLADSAYRVTLASSSKPPVSGPPSTGLDQLL